MRFYSAGEPQVPECPSVFQVPFEFSFEFPSSTQVPFESPLNKKGQQKRFFKVSENKNMMEIKAFLLAKL